MFDWKRIVQAITHQKYILILTTLVIGAAGTYAIRSLPDIYESSARILVERRGLFSETETVPGRNTQDVVSRRMHAISSMVLSTDSIRELMSQFDILAEPTSDEQLAKMVEDFRERAVIDLDNVAVVNQFTGKPGMYSQGLIVSFEDSDPDLAFGIAKAMTDRVLAANRGKSEADVEYRRAFLSEQFRAADTKLSEINVAIAKFKNENALYLPDVNPLTIRRYEEVQSQSTRVEETIARLRRDLNDVRGELGTTSADAFVLAADGTRILGTGEQLRLLEAEYARAKAKYTTNHPELVRLESELAGLRNYADGADTSGIQADLQEARKSLGTALQRYSPEHPDVRAIERRIASLEELMIQRTQTARATAPQEASNPAYNRLLIREKGIIDDIALERQKLNRLTIELGTIKGQLARMPTVEQELETLLQRQEAAVENYEEIETELDNLYRSSGLSQADLLDRFVLIEPPRRAYSAAKPPKKLLLALLCVFSVLAGFVVALLVHLYRDLILGEQDIAEIVDLPVCMIPKLG